MKTVVVTGGCGFIGSHFVRMILRDGLAERVINVDGLTYAGRRDNVADLGDLDGGRHVFLQRDITDRRAMDDAIYDYRPDAICNLAAESHVDRSIADPFAFVRANIVGVATLVELARKHGVARFLQVSTDEVYGSLGPEEPPFTELSPIAPSTPYSVSKVSGDYIALSYAQMYGMHVVVTRCSNNYGTHQHHEKFLPLAIGTLLRGEPVPLHLGGCHVRDWIHVEDQCRALWAALTKGRAGEVYNLGGAAERRTIDVAHLLCDALDKPRTLTTFVPDRPGNDRRYAMDFTKAEREIGFRPSRTFEASMPGIIDWYKAQAPAWWGR